MAPHPAAAGTAVLVVACLLCAAHLWRRGGAAAWGLHVVLTAAMLMTYLPSTGHDNAHAHAYAHTGVATGLAAWAGAVAGLLAAVALLLAAVRGCDALHLGLETVGRPTRRGRSTDGALQV